MRLERGLGLALASAIAVAIPGPVVRAWCSGA